MFDLFKPTRKKAQKRFDKAMRTGRLEPAIAYYRKYLAANADDYQARNDLAWMLIEIGRAGEAVEALEQAIELHEDAISWNNMGRALLTLKRFDEADRAFDTAYELDPDDPKPAYNKAVGLRKRDDLPGCKDALESLLQHHPEYAPALNDLALCLQEEERFDEAIPYLERAVAARPDWVAGLFNLVTTLCELDRHREATPHIEALADLGHDVSVDADDEYLTITVNGAVLYSGERRGETSSGAQE